MLVRDILLRGALINAVTALYKGQASSLLYKLFQETYSNEASELFLNKAKERSIRRLSENVLIKRIARFSVIMFAIIMGYENICNNVPPLSLDIENVNALLNRYKAESSKLEKMGDITSDNRKNFISVYLLGEIAKRNYLMLLDRIRELELVENSRRIFENSLSELQERFVLAINNNKANSQDIPIFEANIVAIIESNVEVARKLKIITHLNPEIVSFSKYEDIGTAFDAISPVAATELGKFFESIDKLKEEKDHQELLDRNRQFGIMLGSITKDEVFTLNKNDAFIQQKHNAGISLSTILMSFPSGNIMSTLPPLIRHEEKLEDDEFIIAKNGETGCPALEGIPKIESSSAPVTPRVPVGVGSRASLFSPPKKDASLQGEARSFSVDDTHVRFIRVATKGSSYESNGSVATTVLSSPTGTPSPHQSKDGSPHKIPDTTPPSSGAAPGRVVQVALYPPTSIDLSLDSPSPDDQEGSIFCKCFK